MENSAEKKYNLTVRPPKAKNLLFALIFAVLTASFLWVILFAFEWAPEILAEKILNCLLFAISVVGFIFTLAGMLDSIRNIFALPTFKIEEENIFICKYGTAPLSELESAELKKNGKILVFNFKDGSSAVLRSRLSDIPLKTVEYSIFLNKK